MMRDPKLDDVRDPARVVLKMLAHVAATIAVAWALLAPAHAGIVAAEDGVTVEVPPERWPLLKRASHGELRKLGSVVAWIDARGQLLDVCDVAADSACVLPENWHRLSILVTEGR